VFFAILAVVILRWIDIPPLSAADAKSGGRPMGTIARQPAFIVAVLTGVISYGVMNLLMTATPLAMVACQHPFRDAAFVIQWHIIGMFAPSFFTGPLIQRTGPLPVMLAGTVLVAICLAVALSGIEVMHFWLALFLLGVGWNFMYVGASALLTEAHTPAERAKTQAANDFMVFLTMAISSMSSGVLLNKSGLHAVNYGSIPFLVLAAGATLWLMWQRRAARAAA
jgi:MFS family permease